MNVISCSLEQDEYGAIQSWGVESYHDLTDFDKVEELLSKLHM